MIISSSWSFGCSWGKYYTLRKYTIFPLALTITINPPPHCFQKHYIASGLQSHQQRWCGPSQCEKIQDHTNYPQGLSFIWSCRLIIETTEKAQTKNCSKHFVMLMSMLYVHRKFNCNKSFLSHKLDIDCTRSRQCLYIRFIRTIVIFVTEGISRFSN